MAEARTDYQERRLHELLDLQENATDVRLNEVKGGGHFSSPTEACAKDVSAFTFISNLRELSVQGRLPPRGLG